MARFSQRNRRGGAGSLPSTGPVAPAVPDAPTITSINALEGGEFSVTWHSPAAKPAGCDQWDLISEENVNPPTTTQEVDMPVDSDSTTGNVTPPTLIYAIMRAWDPTHTLSTDSAVTTATIDPPDQPSPPTYSAPFEGECDPGQTQSTITAPESLPAGAASFDLYSDSGINPPTTLRIADMTPGSGWDSYCEGEGNDRYSMMRAWNAAHTLYTDSTVAQQAL